VVFPSDNDASDFPFGMIVVNRDAGIIEEDRQSLPELQHVLDRFCDTARREKGRQNIVGPLHEFIDHGSGLLLPDQFPLF